jgi:hypothetical protein
MRPILFSLTERGNIKTLRDAVDWYRKVYAGTEPLGMLTETETQYVNGEWAQVMKELAEEQGVPAGMLSYWLNELAVNEIQLARTALEEATVATEYGVAKE